MMAQDWLNKHHCGSAGYLLAMLLQGIRVRSAISKKHYFRYIFSSCLRYVLLGYRPITL